MDRTSALRRFLGGLALLAVGVLAVACAGPAAPAAPGTSAAASTGVAVIDAWARPAPAGGDSAAYLTITNTGAADTLLSVHCTIARSTMLHETATDASGMTGMSMVGSLPVPAGGSVRLAPGGSHVMLGGLTSALAVGTTIELQLLFEHAGTITIPATIRAG